MKSLAYVQGPRCMKKRLLSTLDSHPEWGDAHTVRDALTSETCFPGNRLWDVILWDVLWEVSAAGEGAGSRSGAEELEPLCGSDHSLHEPTPRGALELNGWTGLGQIARRLYPCGTLSLGHRGEGGLGVRGLSAAEASLKRQLEAVWWLHSLQLGRGSPWHGGWGHTRLCPTWWWLGRPVCCSLDAGDHWEE